MALNKRIPEWRSVGVEPPEELKAKGFTAGYKPPAAYFNWFFNRIGLSVKEIQDALKLLAFKDSVGNDDIIDLAASKIIQDADHRFSTDAEKATWNQIESVKESLEKYASITVLGEILNLPGGGDIAVTGEILSIPLK